MTLDTLRIYYTGNDLVQVLEHIDKETGNFLYTVLMRKTRYSEWLCVRRLAEKNYLIEQGIWEEAVAN
jgi:hypothetical protein